MENDIIKSLFPFSCNNNVCHKEYSLDDFLDVALLWGFILLEGKEDSYVGISCLNCCQTTLRKYSISNPGSLIQHFEETGIDTQKRYRGVRPYFRNYVPFSIEEIENKLEQLDALQKLIYDESFYTLPDIVHPIIDYPSESIYQNSFRISEKAIPKLVEIENNFMFKVFPRIVGFSSMYKKTDRFLLGDQGVINILKNLIETQYGERRSYEKDAEYYKHVYTDMVKDDLSMSDYETIFTSKAYTISDKLDSSNDIINDYRAIRSKLDFELVYRNDFVNKAARSLFIEKMRMSEKYTGEKAEPDVKITKEEISTIKKTQKKILLDSTKALTNLGKWKSGSTEEIKSSESSLVELIEISETTLRDKENVFMRVGNNWFIKFKEKPITLPDNKKIRYVVCLLEKPSQRINNLKLVVAVQEPFKKNMKSPNNDDNFEVKEMKGLYGVEKNLTKKQIREIKQTVKALLDKQKKAENKNDRETIEKINQELDDLKRALETVYSSEIIISGKNKIIIKGREHVLCQEAERSRVNVRNNLNNAYKEISKYLPKLEQYLIQCIDTKSTYAVYDPKKSKTDKSIEWYISW